MIELLAVMVIIVILANILLPALSQVRAAAQAIKCTSNMKQLGLGTMMFARYNDEKMPSSDSTVPEYWLAALMSEIGGSSVLSD